MRTALQTPKICVSLAAESVDILRRDVDRALERADYAEVRFDYLAKGEIEEAVRAVEDRKDRLVFTLRSEVEGGRYAGPQEEYAEIVSTLGQAKPMLLDVEMERSEPALDRLAHYDWDRVIVSHHDTNGTPGNLEGLLDRMQWMSNFVKIVTTANTERDVDRIIRIYDYPYIGRPTNLVAFAMGELGVRSRILAGLRPNSPFTFAALDRPVAPGQLSVEQMRMEYETLRGFPYLPFL